MIIWNGMIASKFKENNYQHDNNVVIFASWVSNSQNLNDDEFNKEQILLDDIINTTKWKLLIYFSSCSVTDESMNNNKYVIHKKHIEETIKQLNNFLIFRISNPIGNTNNPHTILNNFYNKIQANQPINIRSNAKRNFIDLDDLYTIVNHIYENSIFKNDIITIGNAKMTSMSEIIEAFEKIMNKKILYSLENKWWSPIIDINKIENVLKTCNIDFNDEYFFNTVKKYYW